MREIKTRYSRIEILKGDGGETVWVWDKENNCLGCIANYKNLKKRLR